MYHYQPLKAHLAAQSAETVSLSFEDVERILKRRLPPSARGGHSRQWWANSDSHSQARAWLEVGRKAKLDVASSIVNFVKAGGSPNEAQTASAPNLTLSAAAKRLVEDVAEERGVSADEAVAEILDRVASQRRRRTLEWFRENTLLSPVTGAELIRAERDGR